MADGSMRRIEEVKVGELVLTRNENELHASPRAGRVTQVFMHSSDMLLKLNVNGEELTTTEIHPFYVLGRGWTVAAQTEIGDLLVSANGTLLPVLDKTLLSSIETVYNLEVEHDHSFFVGSQGAWVHNLTATAGEVGASGGASSTMSSSYGSGFGSL